MYVEAMGHWRVGLESRMPVHGMSGVMVPVRDMQSGNGERTANETEVCWRSQHFSVQVESYQAF